MMKVEVSVVFSLILVLEVIPVDSDCAPPTVPANGDVSSSSCLACKTYTDGDKVTISCREGFKLVTSSAELFCFNKVWYGSVECRIKDCGSPVLISNGNVTLDSGLTTFNSTARLTCKHGYNISDLSIITCLSTGQWSTGGTCQKISCGNPGPPENGMVELNKGTTSYLDTATVTCKQGYVANVTTTNTIVCEWNGNWKPVVGCLKIGDTSSGSGAATASWSTVNSSTVSISTMSTTHLIYATSLSDYLSSLDVAKSPAEFILTIPITKSVDSAIFSGYASISSKEQTTTITLLSKTQTESDVLSTVIHTVQIIPSTATTTTTPSIFPIRTDVQIFHSSVSTDTIIASTQLLYTSQSQTRQTGSSILLVGPFTVNVTLNTTEVESFSSKSETSQTSTPFFTHSTLLPSQNDIFYSGSSIFETPNPVSYAPKESSRVQHLGVSSLSPTPTAYLLQTLSLFKTESSFILSSALIYYTQEAPRNETLIIGGKTTFISNTSSLIMRNSELIIAVSSSVSIPKLIMVSTSPSMKDSSSQNVTSTISPAVLISRPLSSVPLPSSFAETSNLSQSRHTFHDTSLVADIPETATYHISLSPTTSIASASGPTTSFLLPFVVNHPISDSYTLRQAISKALPEATSIELHLETSKEYLLEANSFLTSVTSQSSKINVGTNKMDSTNIYFTQMPSTRSFSSELFPSLSADTSSVTHAAEQSSHHSYTTVQSTKIQSLNPTPSAAYVTSSLSESHKVPSLQDSSVNLSKTAVIAEIATLPNVLSSLNTVPEIHAQYFTTSPTGNVTAPTVTSKMSSTTFLSSPGDLMYNASFQSNSTVLRTSVFDKSMQHTSYESGVNIYPTSAFTYSVNSANKDFDSSFHPTSISGQVVRRGSSESEYSIVLTSTFENAISTASFETKFSVLLATTYISVSASIMPPAVSSTYKDASTVSASLFPTKASTFQAKSVQQISSNFQESNATPGSVQDTKTLNFASPVLLLTSTDDTFDYTLLSFKAMMCSSPFASTTIRVLSSVVQTVVSISSTLTSTTITVTAKSSSALLETERSVTNSIVYSIAGTESVPISAKSLTPTLSSFSSPISTNQTLSVNCSTRESTNKLYISFSSDYNQLRDSSMNTSSMVGLITSAMLTSDRPLHSTSIPTENSSSPLLKTERSVKSSILSSTAMTESLTTSANSWPQTIHSCSSPTGMNQTPPMSLSTGESTKKSYVSSSSVYKELKDLSVNVSNVFTSAMFTSTVSLYSASITTEMPDSFPDTSTLTKTLHPNEHCLYSFTSSSPIQLFSSEMSAMLHSKVSTTMPYIFSVWRMTLNSATTSESLALATALPSIVNSTEAPSSTITLNLSKVVSESLMVSPTFSQAQLVLASSPSCNPAINSITTYVSIPNTVNSSSVIIAVSTQSFSTTSPLPLTKSYLTTVSVFSSLSLLSNVYTTMGNAQMMFSSRTRESADFVPYNLSYTSVLPDALTNTFQTLTANQSFQSMLPKTALPSQSTDTSKYSVFQIRPSKTVDSNSVTSNIYLATLLSKASQFIYSVITRSATLLITSHLTTRETTDTMSSATHRSLEPSYTIISAEKSSTISVLITSSPQTRVDSQTQHVAITSLPQYTATTHSSTSGIQQSLRIHSATETTSFISPSLRPSSAVLPTGHFSTTSSKASLISGTSLGITTMATTETTTEKNGCSTLYTAVLSLSFLLHCSFIWLICH